jgi:hypothetical protein
MNPYVGLVVDIIMLGALGVAIMQGLRLSRQFDRLKADRGAFDKLIQALNLASSRAEAAIRSLKEAAVESGDKLQDKVNAARGIAEELEIMVQAGDNLAERLNTIAEKSRKATMESSAASAAPDEGLSTAKPRTRAEKELLEAIKAKQQL